MPVNLPSVYKASLTFLGTKVPLPKSSFNSGKRAKSFLAFLSKKGISSDDNLSTIVSSLKERATFIGDLWEQGSFFFETPKNYDEKASKKAFKEDTPQILQSVLEILQGTDDYSAANLSEKIKGWITSQEMGIGSVMMPLRLSLVGAMQGPDVFDIASILGKEESIQRLNKAVETIS